MKLEEGKYYFNRLGHRIGPMTRRRGAAVFYTWRVDGLRETVENIYSANGDYLRSPSEFDLVLEATAPKKSCKQSHAWSVLIRLPNKSRREAREVRNKLAKWGFKAVVCVDLA